MPRILVIEDDPSILTGLRDALKGEGYDVLSARDGKKGLQLGLKENVDLVLLDIMLPGRDGYEICRKLREDELSIPILILSARSSESDKVLGLELGADDYITKPFSVAEVLARVRAALRRETRTKKLKTFSFGNISLDFEGYEATRNGKPMSLTSREFAVLAHFIRNRGRVIPREELLREVWGHEVAPVTRTVDTHIAQLRKKLEKDPAKPEFLVSVRGAGYRFEG